MPAQTPLAAGAACTQNMGMECDGSGQCVGCINASECPGSDGLCSTRTCDMGVCGVAFKPAGTTTTAQASGDCKLNVCDGAGNAIDMTDSSDLPIDTNQCVTPTCTGRQRSSLGVRKVQRNTSARCSR